MPLICLSYSLKNFKYMFVADSLSKWSPFWLECQKRSKENDQHEDYKPKTVICVTVIGIKQMHHDLWIPGLRSKPQKLHKGSGGGADTREYKGLPATSVTRRGHWATTAQLERALGESGVESGCPASSSEPAPVSGTPRGDSGGEGQDWPQRAEVHIKEMTSVSPDSCIPHI